LRREEFEDMLWVDYQRMLVFYYRNEANEWDRTRVMTSMILNTNVEKQHQKRPTQLIPLWIDKIGKERKRITEKDRDRILEAIRRTEECQKN